MLPHRKGKSEPLELLEECDPPPLQSSHGGVGVRGQARHMAAAASELNDAAVCESKQLASLREGTAKAT